MPADNGSGCHLDERFLPSNPALSQYDPEQLVCRSESPARALGVKSEQLLTQGKIFEDDILAGPECTNNPAEEVPEPYDHAQNLTGTLPIELGGKSLILRVYDVLMNDRTSQRTAVSRLFPRWEDCIIAISGAPLSLVNVAAGVQEQSASSVF